MSHEDVQELKTQASVESLMSPEGGAALIDFWAPWCGPCRGFAPTFEAAAGRWREEPVRFFKLNTQDHPELAAAFHIRSIPTLIYVLNGEIQDVQIGAQRPEALEEGIAVLLSKARGESFWHRLLGKHRKGSA